MNKLILKQISAEIEQKHNVKVIDIRLVQLISLCVDVKVQFEIDSIYKPFDEMPTPYLITFSNKTASFYKRVDLFDCVKNKLKSNEN